jgi:hypothetical protein
MESRNECALSLRRKLRVNELFYNLYAHNYVIIQQADSRTFALHMCWSLVDCVTYSFMTGHVHFIVGRNKDYHTKRWLVLPRTVCPYRMVW